VTSPYQLFPPPERFFQPRPRPPFSPGYLFPNTPSSLVLEAHRISPAVLMRLMLDNPNSHPPSSLSRFRPPPPPQYFYALIPRPTLLLAYVSFSLFFGPPIELALAKVSLFTFRVFPLTPHPHHPVTTSSRPPFFPR